MSQIGLRKSSLIYIAAAALNAVVPFVAMPLFTRWLGPAGFGIVGGFLALVNVLAILIGLNSHALINVSYFRDGATAMREQVGAAVGVLALTAVPLLLVAPFLAPHIALVTSVPADWFWAAWLCASGQFVLAATLSVWQARQQPWFYGVTQVSYTLAWLALSVALVGFANMEWMGRALGQALAAGGAVVVCLAVLSKANALAWSISAWPIKAALSFGLPLVPHSLAAIAMVSVDRFALSATSGPAATGYYFAAFQIASILTAIASALNQAWTPWLFARLARNDASAKLEIIKATRWIYLLLLSLAALLSVAAATLVRLIAGDDFAASAELLVYLAPAAAFSGMYFFASSYFYYANRTILLSIITICAATVQVVLTLWLVERTGAKGAAIATLISSALYWAMTAFAAHLITPIPWLKPFAAERPTSNSGRAA